MEIADPFWARLSAKRRRGFDHARSEESDRCAVAPTLNATRMGGAAATPDIRLDASVRASRAPPGCRAVGGIESPLEAAFIPRSHPPQSVAGERRVYDAGDGEDYL
ncbi:MAG TPA: hypothetical protein VMF09_05030 [Solirubrobacteraceae bacterium]|nr:hypothetical protein [Solirubrobacteraceae bacterium]